MINRGEMSVEYCPTEETWEEILTKPLQGKSYKIIRINIINIPKLYVEPDDNTPEKRRKSAGMSEK